MGTNRVLQDADPCRAEINIHFPQGQHVQTEVAQLMSVPEQIITGQASSPVIKLTPPPLSSDEEWECDTIQDAVVVTFWLTQLQPGSHCPPVLVMGTDPPCWLHPLSEAIRLRAAGGGPPTPFQFR